MTRGKFITLEGVEGVGKTTNLGFIRDTLMAHGLEVIVTREPGGTPLAEELRQILLSKREEPVDPLAELLLVFAARAQHIAQVISPALARGAWVLCDRFTDATYAYQGYGRDLDIALISQLESIVQAQLQPDFTFYLDLDVQIGLRRANSRGDLDRFEQEKREFFQRVREGYLERARANAQRFIVIDASQELTQVQSAIKKMLQEKVLP